MRVADSLESLRFGVYTDAAWANRPDNGSQGGYYFVVSDDDSVSSGAARCLVCGDGASRKLTRMCRCPPASEAEAAALAVFALERARLFSALILDAKRDTLDSNLCQELGMSPATGGSGLAEKRTAIELAIVNERINNLRHVEGRKSRTTSHRQLPYGSCRCDERLDLRIVYFLTKLRCRAEFACGLRRGYHALKFDD